MSVRNVDTKNIREPGLLSALSVSLMVSAALIGILFFAWRVAGMPFVPFDTFDWLTRVLPGRLIAFGIGTMVSIIRVFNLGPIATTAKMAEQAMAIAILFTAGVVGGVILFWVLRAARGRNRLPAGLALGVALGFPAMLISLHTSATAQVGRGPGALWVLAAFLVWGAALGWAEQRLIGIAQPTQQLAEPEVERIDRRRFIVKLGGTAALITVAGAVVGELAETRRREAVMTATAERMRWSTTHSLPNANAAVRPAPGTRPDLTSLQRHYRIDINTIPPKIDEQRWRLNFSGLMEKPLALTLEQLQSYEPIHQFVTLSCISNPIAGDLIGTQRWTGVSLQRLLPDLRFKPGATHLKIRSADGFFEVVPLGAIKADPRIMLTYAWDGVPLEREHGFPLRIYVPDVYGMKQPKWIESIEATDHWEPGYWVERGWSKVAQMHATSVVDTVAVDMTMIDANDRKLVPIGGIAHAGARGISIVEVQVDGGPWERAELRTPLSELTWVIWRYDWPYQPGRHSFTVRCYEGNGMSQIVTDSPPEPDGATGLDTKSMML